MASALARKITVPSSFYFEQDVIEDLTINNFSKFTEGEWDVIRLSNEMLNATICAIKFYPNGNCPENDGYISIEFIRYIQDPEVSVNVKCVASVVDNEGNSRLFQSFNHLSTDGLIVFGIDRFVKRSTLLERSDEFLPDDKLSIRCEIAYNVSSGDPSIIWKNTNSGVKIPIKFCDDDDDDKEKVYLDIETAEGEVYKLPLEKDIQKTALCRKSRVFARMLNTAMSEKYRKRVQIKDINHTTLLNLLSYVNSESFMTNNVQETVDLYIAADKYEVLGLRVECASDLCRNMAAEAENVCNILILADMHNDIRLKHFALSVINDNKDAVMESSSYCDLVEKMPHLVLEIEAAAAVYSDTENEETNNILSHKNNEDENLLFYS